MNARWLLLLAFFAVPAARHGGAARGRGGDHALIRLASVVLQRTDVEQTVCVTPCNRWLDPRRALQNQRRGHSRNEPLPAAGRGGTGHTLVRAGSSWRYGTGWALTGAAGVSLSAAAVILFATSWGATDANTPEAGADIGRWKPRGEALLASGLALAAGGVYLLVTSQTHVRFNAESSPVAPQTPSVGASSP